MTTPAVITKVSTILAQTKKKYEIVKLLLTDIAGEVAEKEYSNKGRDGGVISFLESKLHRYLKTEVELSSVLDSILPYFTLDAIKKNKVMVIEELVKYDKNLLGSISYEGFTLFHAIPMNYHKKILNMLSSKIEEKKQMLTLLNQRTVYGLSPLDYAIKLKNGPAIEDLIRLGALYDQENMNSCTVADILE